MYTYYISYILKYNKKLDFMTSNINNAFVEMDSRINYRSDIDKLKNKIFEIYKDFNYHIFKNVEDVQIVAFSLLEEIED